MSEGESAANSGLKPLKSRLRSRAGWVRLSGIVDWSGSSEVFPTPWVSEM